VNGRCNSRRAFLSFFIGSAVTCFLFQAKALDPAKALNQYIHDRWGVEQGFPGGAVYAFAETGDGYLWIGAEKGLVRFDGSNFELFHHGNSPELPVSPVLGLATDAGGSLWVRLKSPGLLRYRNKRFESPLPPTGSPETGVTTMLRGKRGELFLARSNEVLKYSDGTFATLASAGDRQNLLVISMAETEDGNVWLGTRDAGLFFLNQGKRTMVTKDLPDQKVNTLLAAGGSQLWIGTDSGVVRWTGTTVTRSGVPAVLQRMQILAMTRDRDSNIWVAGTDALIRVNASGAFSLDKRTNRPDDRVSALFEDRDGNLWAGSAGGVERFRETLFTTYAGPAGRRAQGDGPLYVDLEDRTWFAPSDGGLFWLRGPHVERVTQHGLAGDVVYAMDGGDGELWAGRQRGGLTRLRYRNHSLSAETYTAAHGLAQTSISAVHRSRDGTVWAGTLGGGVSKLSAGKFTTYTTADGLASDDVKAIAEDSDRSMWFAGPNGLTKLSNGQWRTFTSADGLPPGAINCLFEDSAGVLWIGTDRGLAYFSSGRVAIPNGVPESLTARVLGIAEDKAGWLWITTGNHVLRANRDALRRGKVLEREVREYGAADGLRADGDFKAVIADGRGRVWFSTRRTISVVDPFRLNRSSAPVAAQILAISADSKALNLNAPVHIPAERKRVTLGFAGLSLSAPERVRFRYRLDGFDRDWSEPVATREAAYTNLSPGSYRFRVLASNPDGIWNSPEAAVTFQIAPAFWQTWWFRILAVLAAASSIAGVYRYGLHRVTRQLNLRFEERLAERTRIAQELHDTLLQGFLSASMLLHVTVDDLSSESPLKRPLSRVLKLMSEVTEEGRKTVRGLRSQAYAYGLDQAFSRIPEELAMDGHIDFRVIVEGQRRPLHPVLQDEVYRIGREALVNAFRHSRAKKIEAQLEYGTKCFRVLVRDDGCGITSEVLQSGLEGHWGLIGMRERAERIGGRLTVLTRAWGGTEIQLFVPNHIAFESKPPHHLWKWASRFYSQNRRRTQIQ